MERSSPEVKRDPILSPFFLSRIDLDHSSDSYLQEVRATMQEEPEVAFLRAYTEVSDRDTDGGYGFLAPSFGVEKGAEVIATAAIAKAMSETGKRPLIMSFDDLYTELAPLQLSIVGKMKVLKDVLEERRERRGVIVTGMSRSSLFTEEALRDVPSQDVLSQWAVSQAGAKQALAAVRVSAPLILLPPSSTASERPAARALIQAMPKKERDLLFATIMLTMDIQSWQDLWWENAKKKGPTLFIVAPTVFHAAMTRLNRSHGHGIEDYLLRVTYPSSLFSPTDQLAEVEPALPTGVNAEEFHHRIGADIVKIAEVLK